ncbi:MAG: glutamate--cysteine ligase, partial [Burkholderiales bacterium]
EWGGEILRECEPVAAALDAALGGSAYRDALSAAVSELADPDSLPSARVLGAMRGEHGGSYASLVLAQSKKHREALLAEPPSAEFEHAFERLAMESIAKQKLTEAADRISFDAYLERYLSRELLQV